MQHDWETDRQINRHTLQGRCHSYNALVVTRISHVALEADCWSPRLGGGDCGSYRAVADCTVDIVNLTVNLTITGAEWMSAYQQQ